jgi:GH24 family phage-related lysozyme (muramidase)
MAITNDTMLDPSIDRRLAVDLDAAESDKLVAYLDIVGNWTCGRGHLLPRPAPGRSWENFEVSQTTSDRWFNDDILAAMRLAQKWPEFPSCDTDCRRNALYELAFNLGGRWETFVHARAAIQVKDWRVAYNELLDSAWAKQVQPGGLDKPGRATRIANYFLTGAYPNG